MMSKNKSSRAIEDTLEQRLHRFFSDATTTHGYLLYPDVCRRLAADHGGNAKELARRVLLENGLDPDDHPSHLDGLHATVLKWTGVENFSDYSPVKWLNDP